MQPLYNKFEYDNYFIFCHILHSYYFKTKEIYKIEKEKFENDIDSGRILISGHGQVIRCTTLFVCTRFLAIIDSTLPGFFASIHVATASV